MSSDKSLQIQTPRTSLIQADPSNFHALVQKLTGVPDLPLTMSPSLRPNPKPPVAGSSSPATAPTSSLKPGFKLHKWRQRKLETIQLVRDHKLQHQYFNPGGFCGRCLGHTSKLMVSPVSPLEQFGRRNCSSSPSPRTPTLLSPKVEEEKAIVEKGFYLHPVSPLKTPRPLELLPLNSPRDQQDDSSTSRSSSNKRL